MIAARFVLYAEGELDEAIDFYEMAQPGFGRTFAGAVQRTVDRIRSFPEFGKSLGGSVRTTAVPHFPFSVVYRVDRAEVVVLAIAHQRRRPGYWRNRR